MQPELRSPYLVDDFAPVPTESTVEQLEVITGEIPRDLDGLLVRNGPNPHFEPRGRYHWFDGDGMLHAVRVQNGRASYRNRWIETAGLRRERTEGRALWSGIMEPVRDNPKVAPYKDTANTDVVFHGGVLKALWYLCGRPYKVDPHTLATLGADDFAGTFKGVVSAHAKVDDETGELVFFDYGPFPPFMHFGVADAEGRVIQRVDVELPGPRLPHDVAMTKRFGIVMDLPIVFDERALAEGKWKTVFRRDLPARFGLVPRHGDGAVRWFEAESCYMYHSVNAWEDGDEVVMVGCRVNDPMPAPRPEDGPYGVMMANLRVRAELHRWRFNLVTGATREERICDRNTEFPSVDLRRRGRPSRFAWNVMVDDSTPRTFFEGLVKYDTTSGATDQLMFGPGRHGSEAPFAPRTGATAEDDGYLLSFVHDTREDQSELWIVDAREPSRGAVARLRIPQRVPLGFHATWVPGARLA